jgi:hypothetical protein
MNTKALRTFFENESEQRKALQAAITEGWLEPGTNAALYNAARHAFDPTARWDDAYRPSKRFMTS